jgi:hypothetical protein
MMETKFIWAYTYEGSDEEVFGVLILRNFDKETKS